MKAALLVVDMQEDFCPPNGSLAVNGARALHPIINSLLAHPGFTTRVASLDYHPSNHISFASNHSPATAATGYIDMANPAPGKSHETKPQKLWPAHCIQGTKGAELIPEINAAKIDLYVRKGLLSTVEMYSAFADAFGNLDSAVNGQSADADLAAYLRERGVTRVFTVGVAGEFCVKNTAIDAAKAGFRSYLVEDATRCVDPGESWDEARREMKAAGVSIVRSDGPEVSFLTR